MYNVKAWLNNPNRRYQDGMAIYNTYKPSNKYDVFLGVVPPGIAQVNLLFSKITRIHSKLISQPELIVFEKEEPIKIKKVTSVALLKSNAPKDTVSLRTNKHYLNNLLTLNFSDLSFDDKLVFDNNELLFQEKKTAYLSISDSMRSLRSLHAKLKATGLGHSAGGVRKTIMQDIAFLDDQVADSWAAIDKWDDAQVVLADSSADTAVAKALADQKRIKANKIFIKRALKSIPLLKDKSLKDKNKKIKKQHELDKRLKELEILGVPYKY